MKNATIAEIQRLVQEIKALLIERGEMLATAESCTGGLIASSIVAEPGTSAVFSGGIVAYQNEVKESLLGIPHSILETYGAVSAETVQAMALGATLRLNADWAVATSGIAGPEGGSKEKPVGLVWMCVFYKGNYEVFSEIFKGSRTEIREKTVEKVLKRLFFKINSEKSCTSEH